MRELLQTANPSPASDLEAADREGEVGALREGIAEGQGVPVQPSGER